MTKSSLFIALALTLVCNSAFAEDKKINDPLLDRAISSFGKRKETADKVLEKAKERHAQDIAVAKKSLILAVDAAIKRATRLGNLEKAQAILAMRKQLEAGSSINGSPIASASSTTGFLHACANHNYTLRINGKAVTSGGVKGNKPVKVSLKPGDIITVKVSFDRQCNPPHPPRD